MPAGSINWPAIKKRYLLGEKPKDIAVQYGLTAKQISNKAQAEQWLSKKQEISAKVVDSVLATLEELNQIALETARDILVSRKDDDVPKQFLIGFTTALKLAFPNANKTDEDLEDKPPERIGVEGYDPYSI